MSQVHVKFSAKCLACSIFTIIITNLSISFQNMVSVRGLLVIAVLDTQFLFVYISKVLEYLIGRSRKYE